MMRTKILRPLLATVACAALVVTTATGCSSGTSSEPDDSLVMIQSIAPSSLNPNIDKTRANVRIQNQIIETAIRYKFEDGSYELDPRLVTEWEQTAPNEWTFEVRPDVEFSNGEKLTSEAFDFTLDAILEYTGGKLAFFFTGWEIEVVDEMTFKVITPLADDSTVPGVMTQFFVVPPEYFAEVGADKYGEKPIGTGPYVLEKFSKGFQVDLSANGNYWGEKATIQKVTIRAVPDNATRVSELLAGQADIADGVPQPLISRISGSDDHQIMSMPTANQFFLMFNTNLPPFDDVRVRQAMNYAIDQEEITENLFKETAQASTQWYVPSYPGFDEGYDPYPHDLDKAAKLLKEAGYSDGVDIDFYFPVGSNPMDQQSAEVIQAQLQDAGFRVQMHSGEPAAVRSAFSAGDQSGFLINSYAPPSLDVATIYAYYLREGSSYSRTAVSHKAVERVDKAAATADEKQRLAMYNEAQEMILGDEAVFVPLWTLVDTWGAASNIDFSPEPFQAYYLNEIHFND